MQFIALETPCITQRYKWDISEYVNGIIMKPEVNVVVDKIRFTYIVPKTKMNSFNAAIQYIFNASEIFKGQYLCKFWKNKYTSQVIVYFDNDFYLFVQAGTNHGNLYLAFEFNASNLTNEKWEILESQLDLLLPNGYRTLYYEGKITYIEIAIDIKHVNFENTKLFDYKLRNVNQLYLEDGSLILGNANGARSLIVYDKAKQLKDAKGIVLNYPLLRIEAKLRPSLSPQNLADLKNPFFSVFVFNKHTANNSPFNGEVWAHFKKCVFDLGIEPQQVYLSLPKGAHLAVHLPLIFSRPCWWNLEQIWDLTLEAFKGLQPNQAYLSGMAVT